MRFLAYAVLVIATTYATKICEPGTISQDGSNSCSCLSDGTSWVCTDENHPQSLPNDPLLGETHEVAENEDTCEPGKAFKYYCNTCTCGNDGITAHAACTRLYCNPDIWKKDGSLKDSNEIVSNSLLSETREINKNFDTCTPRTNFKYYCNYCYCGNDGIVSNSMCTTLHCTPGFWNKDGSLKNPNEIVNNSLTREQREIEKNEDTCQPHKSFKYYCNYCYCEDDGIAANATCTRMYCSPGIWNKDGSLTENFDIDSFPLLRETREINKNEDTCEPGKRFKYYCNSCSCGDNGKVSNSICTVMYCNPEVWNKDGSLKNLDEIHTDSSLRITRNVKEDCEPGTYFKNYCNSCYCGNDGIAAHAVCTSMYCSPDIWNKNGSLKRPKDNVNRPSLRKTREIKENEDTCEPGKAFKYYCNSCFCGDDGKVIHALCTKMYCSPEHWNKDGSSKHTNGIISNPLPIEISETKEYYKTPKLTTDQFPLLRNQRSTKFLCQPGKKYYDDCNSCVCSRDGKSSVCTQMFCPPKENAHVAPKICDPRKHFKIDCNQCYCSEDGLKVSCTAIACLSS